MKEDDTILTLWEKLKRRAKKQINIKDKENIKQYRRSSVGKKQLAF